MWAVIAIMPTLIVAVGFMIGYDKFDSRYATFSRLKFGGARITLVRFIVVKPRISLLL